MKRHKGINLTFQPDDYGPLLAACWDSSRLLALGPGQPEQQALAGLEALTVPAALAPHRVVDHEMASACLAGAWLFNDYLERSHEISQSIDTPTGSYWHGIMHRREPDESNAKYWFRRVGFHPVFADLGMEARRLAAETPDNGPASYLAAQADWDPFRFVDLCALVRGRGDAAELLCRRIATRECELLFDFCFQKATQS